MVKVRIYDFVVKQKAERQVRMTDRREVSHMDTMHHLTAQASRSNSNPSQPSEYVVRTLDQLEDLGKYSVIYEIARIETMLSHVFISDKHLPPNFSCG